MNALDQLLKRKEAVTLELESINREVLYQTDSLHEGVGFRHAIANHKAVKNLDIARQMLHLLMEYQDDVMEEQAAIEKKIEAINELLSC